MIRPWLLAALVAITTSVSAAQHVAMLAVVHPGGQAEPLLTPGVFDLPSEDFLRHLDSVVNRWRRCASVMVFDREAKVQTARFHSAIDDELDPHQMLFRFAQPTSADASRLAWCGGRKPIVLALKKASQNDLERLPSEPVDALIQAALGELREPAAAFGSSWTVERTAADLIAPQYLIERQRVTFSGGDNRGYVFRVWHLPEKKVLWQRFGHPEWSPQASNVHEVSAELFFRLPDRKGILMLGRFGQGWESTANAVYRLDDGAALWIAP